MKRLYLFIIFCIPFFFAHILPAQVDNTPPYIKCKNFPFANCTPNCTLTMWASDFIDSLSDDQSSDLPITLGIRRICTGTGFPENKNSLFFIVYEFAKVEVWARDAAGNTVSDTCFISITDPIGNCDPSGTSATVFTPENEGIGGVSLVAEGHNCINDAFYFPISGSWSGYYGGNFGGSTIPPGYQSTITPSKSINPLNGVSTYDMVLIAKHILNIQPFNSPYQYIAADVNQDNQITATDLLILKQLIQGNITELPNNKSWRFVPKDFVFSSTNPLQTPFPERINVPNTDDPVPYLFSFYGIKIGDVNHSADPGL